MERAVFVYTTYPSVVEAERAGRAIVERRLAACVNILPGMVSHSVAGSGRARRGGGDDHQDARVARRGGARRGQGEAFLHDAGDPGAADRKRRRGYLAWMMAETAEGAANSVQRQRTRNARSRAAPLTPCTIASSRCARDTVNTVLSIAPLSP